MRVFTVHARDGAHPRTRLVREGFSFWAFLLGPLWLLGNGLWLALAGFVPLAVAIAFIPEPWQGWGVLALHLILGLHGRDLLRWTLGRRGFATAGVVAGRDEEEALLRLLGARPALLRGMLG